MNWKKNKIKNNENLLADEHQVLDVGVSVAALVQGVKEGCVDDQLEAGLADRAQGTLDRSEQVDLLQTCNNVGE